jgi:glucans biosynthesis protein
VRRRELILAGLSLPLASFLGKGMKTFAAAPPDASAFDDETVAQLARALAGQAYRPPDQTLPESLAAIGYDQYRDYRYRPDRALWREAGLPFQAQFFHRGFLHKDRVDIYEVAAGKAARVVYEPDMFTHGRSPAPKVRDLGFAGFRLHGPINRPGYFDEIVAFLGASYFRAVAKGQSYGLSARGLALKTGDPEPEEFPVFKAFWLERPAPHAEAAIVHALLDGPSAAAAFRFAIRPGVETVIDVDMRLYPRVELARAGIAPLTSMFYFDASDRLGIDDYRPAVHDSDGLALLNGRGEQVWRPLRNPGSVQMSGFQDDNPRGFGLMQRKRNFYDYLDLEAGYQKRPSLWVEPLGDWGEGAVTLVEIPTTDEYHDNIVAFWRPKSPFAAGREYRFRYRQHWCMDHAWQRDLAVVGSTRIGKAPRPGSRLVVVELYGGRLHELPADAKVQVDALASKGTLRNPVAYRNSETGHWRMSFEVDSAGQSEVELRARLKDGQGPLSETWLYRWNG